MCCDVVRTFLSWGSLFLSLDEWTGLLEDIKGRVLEIGPGPATNFRCLYPPTEITEWVGVEPNNYFLESIEEQKRLHNISFSTQLTWLKGENIDVDDESFDAVMGTHVLCSVSDVDQVSRRTRTNMSTLMKVCSRFYAKFREC